MRVVFLNPMTLTTATALLYLAALFLSVATLQFFSYFLFATQTISPKQADARFFLVLFVAVIPFVMTIYFGLAFIIADTISLGTTFPTTRENELSFPESLVAAVTYVILSGWLWLRWRNLIGRTGIFGPAIIAAAIVFLIVGVIWAAHHDHII